MNEDEMAEIFRRMMQDPTLDDPRPDPTPRCDGCGRRLPLDPWTRTTSEGDTETLYYCADCRRVTDGGRF